MSDVTGGAVASPPSVRRQLDNVGYTIPRSKTRGLRDPGAKTAKIWPGHILKLESVPNAKSPKNLTGGVFQNFSKSCRYTFRRWSKCVTDRLSRTRSGVRFSDVFLFFFFHDEKLRAIVPCFTNETRDVRPTVLFCDHLAAVMLSDSNITAVLGLPQRSSCAWAAGDCMAVLPRLLS